MKASNPAISVIIPMYNAKKYIQQAVDSVLNQTFKDCEVIIVDDCSTDGSYELCQSLYSKSRRVEIIHHTKNMGVSIARNAGIRESKSKYVAFLDNDDVFLPHAMEVLYNNAEKHQAEVVSSIGYLMSNDENIPKDFSGITRICVEEIPVTEVTVFNSPPPPPVK